MACSDEYTTGARDHVTEVNDNMLAELMGRTCPRCGFNESRSVETDVDDHDMTNLPLRVCVACNELYGFDDSTSFPDHLLPVPADEKPSRGGIWDRDDDYEEEVEVAPPRQSSPCFRDADWGWGNKDEGRDHDQDELQFWHAPSATGRGRRSPSGGGGGHRRGRRHHYEKEHQHNRCHNRGGRGQTGCGGTYGQGSAQTSASSDSDALKQVAGTCLQSTSRCALGFASSLVSGDYGGAVATASEEMEPIGRAVGSMMGSCAGDVIGSPRAGEIGADIGSVVGRGVAEMLKDSSLCNQRTSSQYD